MCLIQWFQFTSTQRPCQCVSIATPHAHALWSMVVLPTYMALILPATCKYTPNHSVSPTPALIYGSNIISHSKYDLALKMLEMLQALCL